MYSAPAPEAARSRRIVATLLVFALAATAGADQASLERAVIAIDAGQFRAAGELIAEGLAAEGLAAEGLSPETRDALLFQRERMRRILLDFPLTAEDVKARIRQQIPDLSDEEFARWDARGLLERQVIDGELRYFSRSPYNLFRLSAEARERRLEPRPLRDGPMEAPNAHHRAVRGAALTMEQQSVLPHRVRVRQSLTVNADAVPAGETLRAWIPYPREIPGQQEDVSFVASVPAAHRIAPGEVLQRTVFLEREAVAGEATEFEISYELTIYGRYQPVDAERVVAATITPELAPFVAEREPHIVFNESLRLFSEQVVGDETNPWRIAQKLFAAVDRIPWAGAREYSTITNISDYTLHAGHGDCGQQTLLLMTLLRLNGIPARWQSGMVFAGGEYGDYWNLHDWGQIYIEPYGWLPMDVNTGRFTDELEWFYLGGLDAWRIAFNDDYSRSFDPPKQHFRSETVDSQRGEVEWDGGNLYFDQWRYTFEAEVLPLTSRHAS